jgi:hypothetical protein
VRFLVPAFVGLIVYALGAHYSGPAAGAFLAALAAVAAFMVGKLVRGRAVRNAPTPPERRAGENPLLHGPIVLRQSQGPDREVWAYLSDQRLNLLPLEGGEGVQVELKGVDEIRPGKKTWKGGELTLVAGGNAWRLRVPDAERWIGALRGAAR